MEGLGSNMLRLTSKPEIISSYDDHYGGAVYGSLYGIAQFLGSAHSTPLGIFCAVCWTRRSAVIMVPGTTICPSGWTTQYKGHLYAPQMNSKAAEYICMDNVPESIPHP